MNVTMSDVADSVSNPQSPVNGILDEPLTLDFDPMSFQLSSPTESKPPIELVDSSPEDPPFINEPVEPPNITNYKYNPKSYLLDLDSLQELQTNMQSTSSATVATNHTSQGSDQPPDLLVDLSDKASGPQASILEEDEDELDLTDPKTEDDSREIDLSVEASESSSSLNQEISSPLPDLQSPTQENSGSPLGAAYLPDAGSPSHLANGLKSASPLELVDLSSPVDEKPLSPFSPQSPTRPSDLPYEVTTPADESPGCEPRPVDDVVELECVVGTAVGEIQSSEYLVSSPESEDLACFGEEVVSPLPDAASTTETGTTSSDMETSSRTTSAETVACASPFNTMDSARSPDGYAEQLEQPLDPVFTSNYTCTSAATPSPTHPSDVADSPEHDDSSEDEFEYVASGSTKSSVLKTKKAVATTTSMTTRDGVTVEKVSVTSTAMAQSMEQIGKRSAYDTLNGLASTNGLTNGSDDEVDHVAIECPVSVSKLKDVYISTDRDTVDAEAFREIAVTGINLKSLKCQYEQTVAEHETLSPTREIISTGIDFKSLKHSYISPLNNKYQTLNHVAEDIVPIDIKSLKSSFTECQQEQREVSPGVETNVSIDKAKLQNKFNKIKIDESKCFCKKCGTHVYPVERIIAEKHFYHKNCFRCKECNKLLSVDGYMSHEAEIYCKIHFKQLFQPKARFDNDAGPHATVPDMDDFHEGRQKRHEMIIRENVPEELPPDVVRCDTKADDGLQSLNLDLGNIRQRFETPQEYVPSVGDRSALARSESLFKRLEKYQSVASGDRNGDAHSTESEEENDDNDDPSVVKEKRTKEKVVYEGLSSLKNQWESGSVNNGREKSEETREELAKLRKKMCLGRSESMRQVYQKAVEDANKVQAGRSELISVEGQEAKAISIKEKFETGVVAQETEAEKIERLNREKLEDLSVLSETAVIHEAKNIFKQLDAEVAKQSSAPTSLARSPSNRWSQPSPTKNAPVSPGEVVRSSDPVRDVEVETNELSERFKFFENYKVESKERKRFEMTPPREVKEPSPEFQVQRDPNVVRAADAPEEVIVTDTARRMRERFRELEESANREEVPQGPKPLKRITPPREYTTTTSRNQEHEDSPVVQRDPDIVQCSYRVDEDIVVEADRAKSMRARFENWDAERIAQENKKNAVGAGGENEEECLPQADTAKNLRAKFEAIKDESVRREVARPKPKVNRFVEFPGTPTTDVCSICNKKLYPMERMEVSGLRMHKNCFRCSHCSCHLRLENYTISGGKLYCGPHFKQFFIAKGNYDEGFGREKWSRSASPASREGTEEYSNGERDHLGILDQPVLA
ncbi:uncharacterized protein LOC8031447 isoform X3 [Ixodes scapularis]|uniref:uncharacterized protein LOC8031447 isoform X3 n=1 Tax=Ixodes scapularis TaxID=6945 RepID=UPI001C380499|nr:uncharacterized protein LOC8031447 isoform X3 [Ixodes scapularis]